MSDIPLHGRTALVTGAGKGLGRAHALSLAEHGAKLLINDLSQADADAVAQEICSRGGRAIAFAADVSDFGAITALVEEGTSQLGPIDILVNNAGILRDKSFAHMSLEDFRLIMDVHVMGAVHCTKAVWEGMCARQFGRIIFTTSSSGLYGNFGQSNYSAAKMALVGLMQTLALEGVRKNVRVNCLAPSAATDMTAELIPAELKAFMAPEAVSPAVIALCADDAPTRTILLAGGGHFAQAQIGMTKGLYLADHENVEMSVLDHLPEIGSFDALHIPSQGLEQQMQEIASLQSHIAAHKRGAT